MEALWPGMTLPQKSHSIISPYSMGKKDHNPIDIQGEGPYTLFLNGKGVNGWGTCFENRTGSLNIKYTACSNLWDKNILFHLSCFSC